MSVNPCLGPRAGGVVVIALPPQVDVTNARQLGAELARALEDSAEVLVVDGTATEFCDSAGVQMLVRVGHQAAAGKVGLRLATDARPVRRVLQLTGADQVIDMYADLATATHDLAVTG